MKVIVAIDSLKGSLSSLEAGNAVKKGILNVSKDFEVVVRPLADGGEGTVEALTLGSDGHLETVSVTGPLGEKITSRYGILGDGKTAIMEMSSAAGITHVDKSLLNPLNTTTYGVGEMINDAIAKGCRHFIVGIGGSATNDGGIGMLQALGYGILDKNGRQVCYGAKGLKDVKTITDSNVNDKLSECTFRIACDVKNTLCGEQGCSAVFGPQKGATPEMIKQMDKWLSDFAALSKENFSKADPELDGTGAAGGLGFAFLTYTNAVLESGIKIVLDETRLEEYIKEADMVVTGEGRLDGQTVMGKAPIGVADIAKKHGKPVIAFAGCVTEDAVKCNNCGIDAFFPILRSVLSLTEAMSCVTAEKNMTAAAEQVFRLVRLIKTEGRL